VIAETTTKLAQTTDWVTIVASVAGTLGFLGLVLGAIGRAFWRRMDQKLTSIDNKATPNGGTTLNLGDTAARTEVKLDELRGWFLDHILHHPPAGVSASVPRSDVPTRAAVQGDNTDDAKGQHQYTPRDGT
jgi:hypothetical protein